jgi:hypothetical protein
MTQSVYHKLLAARNACYEHDERAAGEMIEDLVKLRQVLQFRREDDTCRVSSIYCTMNGLTINLRIPKMDPKFIWLTCEVVCDITGRKLADMYDDHTSGYFVLNGNGGRSYSLCMTFYFSQYCTPIYETESHRVVKGYRCE